MTRLGPLRHALHRVQIGRRALADSGWLAEARARLAADAAWLDARLAKAGFAILGGTPLFRLAARKDAHAAFAALAGRGVLTRPFTKTQDRLRFGLPRLEQRARVEAASSALAAPQAVGFASSAS